MRGSITSEMWEVLNTTWLELQHMNEARLDSRGRDPLLRLGEGALPPVPRRDGRHRAADEAFHFNRLGTFLERADNTARILDVKYHVLLPSVEDVGGAVDYYQWAAVLRSVTAFESYRKVYRDVITPLRVAELLILRDDMPRSLHSCMDEVYDILQLLATPQAREAVRLAGELHAELHFGRIDGSSPGLHEYLTDFLDRTNALGGEINRRFFNRGLRVMRQRHVRCAIMHDSCRPTDTHDLLRRPAAGLRDPVRLRLAHQRRRGSHRHVLQDEGVREQGRARDGGAVAPAICP